MTLVVEQIVGEIACPQCGRRAYIKERPLLKLIDLPAFGGRMQLGWKKHRMVCRAGGAHKAHGCFATIALLPPNAV